MTNNEIITDATRPDFDEIFKEIASYVMDFKVDGLALELAKYSLMDSLGCAALSTKFSECRRILGPIVKGAELRALGCKIPFTNYQLEPARAAFNIGTMVRYLDYNDTFLAKEWGHPSDNLGALWAVTEYKSRKNMHEGKPALKLSDFLSALVKAYEIQGVLSLDNSWNEVGLDHVILVKIASTALATYILGGSKEMIINALTQAFVDGGTLRLYRHAPNAGSRKSWAAGDATKRGVELALLSINGEMGYPGAINAAKWGFKDVLMRSKEITIARELNTFIIENILFKVKFPAEFHAQTAVEAAIQLHAEVKDKLNNIKTIIITTQEASNRIINKVGKLSNPADRDHCLQYMVAVPLIYGRLNSSDYLDNIAKDNRIDEMRDKMKVVVSDEYTKEYYEDDRRAISNAIEIIYNDGTRSKKVEIKYPLGHKKRRKEAMPHLINKFINNISNVFNEDKCEEIKSLLLNQSELEEMNFNEFSDQFIALDYIRND